MNAFRVRASRGAIVAAAPLALGGCTGAQAAFDPAGPPAQRIANLWWMYCGIGIVVYLVTMLFVLLAARRKGNAPRAADVLPVPPDTQPSPARERRMAVVISGAVGLTMVVLLVLMVAEFVTARSVASLAGDKDAMKVRVVARQWWWEVRYEEKPTSEIVVTANEIHIPVGRTIRFDLESPDVIHSFWVPKLHGKKDIIPGHGASIYVKADKPGMFFGQCAEFCGYQHAKMRFVVVAETPEAFERWRAAQLQPAPEHATDVQRRGREVFLGSTCVTCHTISGTPARGTVGPNLTHVAGRAKLAAGSLPNTPGHLAGWIIDPQRIKPGVRMPQHQLTPHDLRALLEYLETLK